MNILEETKYIMNKYDVHPNKRLGQNFLFDEQSLQTIASEVTSKDTVIEIGPGLGTLTAILAEKASKVIAVELDGKMVSILKERFKLYNNVQIIQDDILNVDIDKIAPKAKIVANLPYYITTSIITKLLNTNIKDITILIQKEVAERLTAKPGSKSYGSLTVYLNYYFNINYLFNVSKYAFNPIPKVESAVVNFERIKNKISVKNEKLFFKLINDSFKMKRKTLKNNLKEYNWTKIKTILEKRNLNESVRAEELSIEIFVEIANALS